MIFYFLTPWTFQAVQRILEAHANVKDLSLVDAKMQYIKAWQALPEYGIAYFLVKHMGHKVWFWSPLCVI